MAIDLARLYDRLPEHRSLITYRYRVDPTFREMCDDFCHVCALLVSMQPATNPARLKNVRHWEDLLAEIEGEILEVLHSRPFQPARSTGGPGVTCRNGEAVPEPAGHDSLPSPLSTEGR